MSPLENTLCIGKVFLHLEKCASTNNSVKEWLAKNAPLDGMVFSTDNQTQGRGQYGNSWQTSPHKNLTFSVLLRPPFLSPQDQFQLSIITSLACVEALDELSHQKFSIKWPNDIFYNNKKIGGNLIENQIQQRKIATSILGIGLNINQTTFDNLPLATSLKLITEKDFSLEKCLQTILEKLDKYYLVFRQGKKDLLLQSYYKKMLNYGQIQQFKLNDQLFEATIKGIDAQGRLHIQKDQEDLYFGFKEIEFVF